MAIASIQSGANQGAVVNPSLTLGSSVTAGNNVIIVSYIAAAGTLGAPTCTIGGTSQTVNQLIFVQAVSGVSPGIGMWYVTASQTGTCITTYSLTANTNSYGAVEYSGMATSSILDGSGTGGASSSSSPTVSTSGASTNSNDVAIAYMAASAATTYTADSNYPSVFTTGRSIFQQRLTAPAGTQTVTNSSSTAINYGAEIAAILPAGSSSQSFSSAIPAELSFAFSTTYTQNASRFPEHFPGYFGPKWTVNRTEPGLARGLTLGRTILETLGGFLDSVADSVTSSGQHLTADIPEALSVAGGAVARLFTGLRQSSESDTTTDTTSRAYIGFRTIQETIATLLNDAVQSLSTVQRTQSNTTSTTDTASRSVAYTRSLLDTTPTLVDMVVRIGILLRVLATESILSSPTLAAFQSIFRNIVEGVVSSSSIARIFSGSRAVQDGQVTTDLLSSVLALLRPLSESLSGSTTLAAAGQYARSLVPEAILSSATLQAARVFFRDLTEAVVGSDTFTRLVVNLRSLNESIQGSFIVSSLSTISRSISQPLPTISQSVNSVQSLIRLLAENILTSEYKRVVLSDAPLAYYRLGEISGTTASDSSGNGHDLTYKNDATRGLVGATYDQDYAAQVGTTTIAQATSQTWFPLGSSPKSIEAWVKYASGPPNATQWYVGGIGGGTDSFELKFEYGGNIAGIDQTDIEIFNGGSNVYFNPVSNAILWDNNWHHVVITQDGSSYTGYLDGQALTISNNLAGTISVAGTSVWIGGFAINNGFNRFPGQIDEWAIYDHVLTPAQVIAHYQSARLSGDAATRTFVGIRSLLTTITSSDTASRLFSGIRTQQEVLALVDYLAASQTLYRAAIDTLTQSQTLNRLVAYARTASEVTSILDTLQASRILLRNAAETIIGSDTLTQMQGFMRSLLIDGLTVDALARLTSLQRVQSDALVLTDTLLRVVGINAALTATSTLVDVVSRTGVFQRSLSVASTLADAVSTANAVTAKLIENLVSQDTVNRITVVARTAAELVLGADTVARIQVLSRTFTETVAGSFIVSSMQAILRNASESDLVSDTANRSVHYSRAYIENVNALADSVSRTISTLVSLSTATSLTDVVNRSQVLARTSSEILPHLFDIATTNGDVLAFLGDTILTVASVARVGIFSRATTDTSVLSDVLVRGVSSFRSIADGSIITVAVNRVVAQFSSIAEQVPGSDAVNRIVSYIRTNPISIPIGDLVATSSSLFAQLSEIITNNDALKTSYSTVRSFLESNPIATTTTRMVQYSREVTNSGFINDTISFVQNLTRFLSDTTTTSDITDVRRGLQARIGEAINSLTDVLTRRADIGAALSESLNVVDVFRQILDRFTSRGQVVVTASYPNKTQITDVSPRVQVALSQPYTSSVVVLESQQKANVTTVQKNTVQVTVLYS
jgi:hypothetical protein